MKRASSVFVDNNNPWKHFSFRYSSSDTQPRMKFDNNSLATNLASLLQESRKQTRSRSELKRFLELRIKKRVKQQFIHGKFHHLFQSVIANPYTLQDAYHCLRLNSNIILSSSNHDDIDFHSLAQQLFSQTFDINANLYSISTKPSSTLLLPNLHFNVILEAIRITLQIVYKPHFSKISHGSRTGRGHSSAFNYLSKQITNPCFTLPLNNKKLDTSILAKLFSTMETKIQDPALFSIIQTMFHAGILNFEFGGFAKGHGLPQEGVLSPILMNIYLDNFDREILNLSMKYEVLDAQTVASHSKLRTWFRRQTGQTTQGNISGVRVHCCRFMDEIVIVVKGSKQVSMALKSEIKTYMRESLFLDFDDSKTDILSCNDSQGVKLFGNTVKRTVKESPMVRAVHKLKEKVELFALQKQEAWDEGTVRIAKKILGHGFKKVKESEIKHLSDSNSVLSQVSRFRKPGMETDHWYKVLLKIWMQKIDVKHTEESILSKFITESAIPQDLKDAFYIFQNHAKNYVSSETKSTLSLLPESSNSSESVSVTQVVAPLKAIRMCLQRYGIINSQGYPRACHMLVLLDHDHIIDWFYGLINRWLRWYRLCDNFIEVKVIITDKVRKSCIRTLAMKYRIHETEIERKFDLDLSRLPSTIEETENETLVSQDDDEGLFYGIPYSGLCLLSLARIVSESRPCTCFVIGCRAAAPCVYTIHVMQKQKFPVWNTGFSSCIHPSIHGRRIGLCKQHVKDLFIGQISLQSISFAAWK